MKCEKCGREISETDKFCGICGMPNPVYQGDDPAREYPFYTPQGSDTVGEYSSYTRQRSDTSDEYNPYARQEPADMKMAGKKAKVKRTCSLSAVVVCIVVIFLLSIACGVFAGLYFSQRTSKTAPSSRSATVYETGGETW